MTLRQHLRRRYTVVPWLLAAGLLVVAYLVGTIDATFDLKADRLTALAALDGANPYVPVDELADRYDSELAWTHVHPRTPGALVLQTPLALVPESALRLVSVVFTAVALTAATAIAWRIRAVRLPVVIFSALLFGVTSIAVESATVGAQSSVVALLLALAWWRTRQTDDVPAGIALGMAVTLKVFPWLLIVLLVAKRRWTALTAVGAAGVLNLAGLLFPGVTVPRALGAVSSANLSESAALNASLTRFVGGWFAADVLTVVLAVCGVLGVAFVVRSDWSFDRQWFTVMAASLAASPLVWRHYALVLIPALVWLVAQGDRTGRIVVALSAVVFFMPDPLISVWLIVPLCLAVALAAHLAPVSAGSESVDGDVSDTR